MPRVFPSFHAYQLKSAHLNDMENILPYLSIGLLYVLTNPTPIVAANLIRVATVARFTHTLAYAVFVCHRARGISFGIHYLITIYMAVACTIHYCH